MAYDSNNERNVAPPDGLSNVSIFGIAFAAALAVGVIFWSISDQDRVTGSMEPPSRMGQGSSR